ncbi:MAG: hypothetical protein IJ789_08830 [Bacteroidales bacterium]|nr:hypothetical protein [Bacteroidales bacterium]
MKKEEEKALGFSQQDVKGHDRPLADGDLSRLRSAQRLIDEVASQIPSLTTEQIHSVVESDRLPQFQLRRQADRYLLVFCLLVLALVASTLWHTASSGLSPLNVAVLILAIADVVVALRAASSLWLMRQTLRLRHRPYRMARYADRLSRLSRSRRRWLGFVLAGSHNSIPEKKYYRQEFFSLRLPSYSIAACLFLLIALNADKAFAATRNYVNVTTTTAQTATAICDTVGNIIDQL